MYREVKGKGVIRIWVERYTGCNEKRGIMAIER